MELKEIKVKDILPNFYQPRTNFEKEGIKELADSILSNGLINPIIVRVWKNKYMIVAGERRWRAHKIVGLKTIQTFVKEYKTEGQFMVESLIENLHRKDLSPQEASKFARRIMKIEKISLYKDLAKRLSISEATIRQWFDADDIRKILPKEIQKKVSPTVIYETKGLPEKERVELVKKAVREDFGGSKMRQLVSEIKREPIPEPIQYERTADDVVDNILSNLHDFKYNVDELLKSNVKTQINIEDLSKSKANKSMTTSILHLKILVKFVNALRQRGAKPDKLILALIKSNGKI